MKTLIFKKADNSLRVEVKVDIFATNDEMLVPGFDTKFTAMEIKDTDEAIKLGINVNEIEYSLVGLKAVAQSLAGIGLYLIDAQESNAEVELVAA